MLVTQQLFVAVLVVAMTALTLFAEGETKMPMLSWAGKSKVVNHHNEVPFKVLERKWAFCNDGATDGGNMIIHGDNLAALFISRLKRNLG